MMRVGAKGTTTAMNARYEGVQALRFIAALLVVITHSTLYAGDRLDDSVEVWHFGEVGVDVFFTISGFVMMISAANLVARPNGWKFFGMRRLVRIVPMYWIATTVKVLTVLVMPGAALHSRLQPENAVLSYLFLPSWNSESRLEPVLGVGWTLTFEMFFYAVFTVALLLRVSPFWMCASVMTALAIASRLRPHGGEYWPGLFYLSPIVLYFVVGMAIGLWSRDRNHVRLALSLSGIFAIWAAVAFLRPDVSSMEWVWVLRKVVVSLSLLAVVAFERHLRKISQPFVFFGNASYSLYLFHPLIAPMVPVALSFVGLRLGWLSVVGSVLVAVVVTALIYRFVEQPLTAFLLARLPYVRPRLPVTVEK
jgi:exopolysaccharide production protein ExoZ